MDEGYGIRGNNWGLVLARGVLALIFGILALAWPGVTIFVLVVFFGAYALVDGVAATVRAIGARKSLSQWWLTLLGGLCGIAVGIITFFWPQVTAEGLLILIGVWAILFGIFEVVAYAQARKAVSGIWPLLVSGILGIIFGILVLAAPLAGALAIIWLIALFAILEGIVFIWAAFVLRKATKPPARIGRTASV